MKGGEKSGRRANVLKTFLRGTFVLVKVYAKRKPIMTAEVVDSNTMMKVL
jgi:hypothetical protein